MRRNAQSLEVRKGREIRIERPRKKPFHRVARKDARRKRNEMKHDEVDRRAFGSFVAVG